MHILDYDHLLDAHASEIAAYFRKVRITHDEQDINEELVRAIEAEIIPPTVISIWLPLVETPQCVADNIAKVQSALVRQTAISQVVTSLQTARWKDIWLAMGGVPGLLNLFETLSVYEVRQLARAIGRSYKYTTPEKTQAVTELFESLSPMLFPDARCEGKDQRSLQAKYLQLLPCCSDDCVRHVIMQHNVLGSNALPRLLFTTHTALLQSIHLEKVNLRDKFLTIESLWLPLPGRPAPSIAFQMTVLRHAMMTTDEKTLAHYSVSTLVPCLWSRAIKKKTSTLLETVLLCIRFYMRHPHELTKRKPFAEKVLSDIVGIWGRSLRRGSSAQLPNPDFEAPLREILNLTRPVRGKTMDYDQVMEKPLEWLRYRLLQLILLEHSDIDIDDEKQLKGWPADRISLKTIQLLEPQSAIALLSRLVSANPSCQLFTVSRSSSVYEPAEYSGSYVDHNLISTELHHGNGIAARIATQQIEQRKGLATKSRDPSERAFYAKSVVVYAYLSSHLSILADAITWIKKFSRDPLTVRQLYASDLISSEQSVHLLSGLPHRRKKLLLLVELNSVSGNVQKANNILRLLFDTALEALREPSFDAEIWHEMLTVFAHVVDERARSALWLERHSDFSVEDIYHSTWPDTIRLLVEVEQKALQPGYEALRLDRPGGLLSLSSREAPRFSVYTSRFHNDLAIARDKLWRQHRLSIEPACALIPSPFPRGLPLQCFVHHRQPLKGFVPTAAPYLMKRIKEVVFMQAEHAVAPIPVDDTIKKAIGSFIDNLQIAISLFVLQNDDANEVKERLGMVQLHWMDILCKHKSMSETEASMFLSHRLQPQYPVPHFCDPKHTHGPREHPQRPTSSNHSQNTEWNPAAQISFPRKAVLSTPTTMDCFVGVSLGSCVSLADRFVIPSEWRFTYGNDCVLSTQQHQSDGIMPAGKVIEGLILTALLTLDSKRKSGRRHLTSAFPSSQHIRYPPVYLDSAFLERDDATEVHAVNVLRHLISIVPPTLLASITKSYLESLNSLSNSTELASVEKTAYSLLKLLAKSDKPHLAANMIVDTIVDRHEASSWHRQLLGLGFLRRLPKRSLLDFFTKYSDAIVQKLVHRDQEKSLPSHQRQDSPVKVTTVKQLAQILNASDYISPFVSVDIMTCILKQSKQIDILTAIACTLMARLPRCNELVAEELIEATLSALESTIPIIGAFNERQVLVETQWQDLERTLCVPELYSYNPLDDPPLMHALLQPELSESIKGQFITRIVLPAAKLSSENNKRALQIVLRKYGINSNLIEDIIPFNIRVVGQILDKYKTYLPGSFFEGLHKLMKVNIQPSNWMSQLTLRFKSSNELMTSHEAKMWVSFFDVQRLVLQQLKSNSSMLRGDLPKQSDDNSYIHVEQVQSSTIESIIMLVETREELAFDGWRDIEYALSPFTPTTSDETKAYRYVRTHDLQPVVEAIISHIDGLRTPEWQANPQRQPAMLPSTLKLRSWLLPYPIPTDKSKLSDSELEELTRTIFNFVVESIDPNRQTYTEAIDVAFEAAQKLRWSSFIALLCRLGETCVENLVNHQSEHLSLLLMHRISEQVRQEVNAQSYDDEVSRGIDRLLDVWQETPNEEVRLQAFTCRKEIKWDSDTLSWGSFYD